MTVKELANKRPELTDIEIEDNEGRDLSAYDIKVGRKNTAGNSLGSFAAGANATVAHNSGNDISINDLIDFVNSYSEDSIQIGGKKRAARNSAGRRIARTEEGLRAFYDWFGDSKVVDENGRPLVVYHGTDAEFDTFEKGVIKHGANTGEGFYFTPDKQAASKYGEKVIPVYLRVENLIDTRKKVDEEFAEKIRTIIQIVGLPEEKQKDVLKTLSAVLTENNVQSLVLESARKILKAKFAKADRFIVDIAVMKFFDGYYNPNNNEYVVFSPNQIKSVYNRGSFSRTTNGHQNSLQFHVLFINIHQTIHNIHYATKVSDIKMGVHSIDI